MKKRHYLFFFLLILMLNIFVNALNSSETDIDSYLTEPPTKLRKFLERYEADRAALLRYYNIPNVPVTYFISYTTPISQECFDQLKKFYADWQELLKEIDFQSLRYDGQVEYILFKNLLRREILRLERSENRIKEITPLIPFAMEIVNLSRIKKDLSSPDSKKTASTLNNIHKEIEEVMNKLKRGDLNPKVILAKRAEESLSGLQEVLNSWFHFHYAYDPLFTWWTKKPYAKIQDSLLKYSNFLKEEVLGKKDNDNEEIIANAIGRRALLEELRYEMIPYTPEELIEIGEKELAWCENELKNAAGEMGFGNNWKEALEKIKSNHVEPGKQPDMVRQLAMESIAFVEDRELVTIPELAKKIWRMKMTPSELQPKNPFITGGEVIRMAYPTMNMEHEDKMMVMRSNNIHTSRAIVHHELIPGHHLQNFMNKRYRPYRAPLFRTDFWREGWALYWETFLYDIGFPRNAEDKLGMLFWRMHRCARIIFALNFHLGKMTPNEAIDFLVERVGHERFSAIGEVRRPLERDRPLQPLSYMIGALQYRALRRELVDSGKMTDRQFHDAILQNNYMPVAMLRTLLSEQQLNEDFFPNWKFYD